MTPFLAGLATVGPLSLAAWSYGWLLSGRATFRQVKKLQFLDPEIHRETLGPGHLWFLEYLLVMLFLYALVRHGSERRSRDGGAGRGPLVWLDAVLASAWRPFVLAIPTTLLLWISRQEAGIDVVLDRHNSFLLDPVRFLHHGSFFLVGTALYRMRHDLGRLVWVGPWYLVLSIPIFAGRASLLARDWSNPLEGASAWGLAALGGLFGWLAVFGFLGLFLRLFQRSRPSIRYLADSSFWIYLVHMPIVGFLQDDLFQVDGPSWWKFPMVWTVTLALGFGSYQTLVRYSWVGTWLHGRRERALGVRPET